MAIDCACGQSGEINLQRVYGIEFVARFRSWLTTLLHMITTYDKKKRFRLSYFRQLQFRSLAENRAASTFREIPQFPVHHSS